MKMTAVLLLLVMVVPATMEQTFSQDERDSKQKDVLSSFSCHYLKVKGYLSTDAKLKNLCLKTFNCNDVASKQSCLLFKTRNECSKNSKLSQMYCPFTCNKCGGVPKCNTSVPLGMQSKAIPDSQITASSFYNSNYFPYKARLYMHSYGWTVKSDRRRVGEWLQVDLGSKGVVTGIATQGSKLAGAEWTKSYTLKYSSDGKVFHSYQSGKVFQGNTNKNTVVKNAISPYIYARYIRVYPQTWHNWPAIRMELYGCK